MMSSLYSFEFANSINDLSADEWNGVAGGDYPFLRHEFLAALEASGSVSSSTGWEPHHLLIRKKDRLLGLMPCYLKQHSYGEYVFDWGWADAYHRHGISYYPKLVSSIPFTPCVGPRLVLVDQTNSSLIEETQQFVIDYCENQGFSSWHLLFPEQPACDKPDLLKRVGVQFHWYNKGFSCFEDYLSIMASRKRKSIKKEREKVRAHGIHFRWLEGAEIDRETLKHFYVFYHATYMKRGQKGYLNQAFFERVVNTMPDNVFLVMAYVDERPVASALFFKGGETLYGRYWGCLEEYDQLHFETCYYQGIEYCIKQGLQHFDSGAQGEHKIQRGFEPIETYSWHWIAHPQFRHAIEDFLQEEKRQVLAYRKEAENCLPFKKGN